jgi:hypothetical protein
MSVQAENSRSCSFLTSLGYNGSLVIWTVVRLIATKFNPLVLSVRGFALSNIANIYIFVVPSSSIFACVSVAAETCLLSRYLPTAVSLAPLLSLSDLMSQYY